MQAFSLPEPPPALRGEYRLLIATIEQAFRDADKDPKKTIHWLNRRTREYARRTAIAWLTDDEATIEDEWTFRWTCDQLGFDYGSMRKRVDRVIGGKHDETV